MKFKSNIEVQAGIEDKDGQVGSSGQILASTGGQVDWIDPASIVTSATDVIIECKNTSGVTITKGTPVYQTGNVGATAVIEIAVADASDEDKMAAIGLLQSDLINNAFGYVVVTGELLNITTSPIDGSTPTVGDTIYVKPGGGLTLTKPTGVNFIQNVGLIGKVSSGNSGSITVSSIMRTNDVPNLPEGRIWVGDGNTIVSDTVYVDEPNLRLGIGTTSPDKILHIQTNDSAFGSVRIQRDSTTQGETSIGFFGKSDTPNNEAWVIGENGWGNDGDFVIGNENGGAGGNVRMLIQRNGNVGIGTTSPGTLLEISGNSQASTPALRINCTDSSVQLNQVAGAVQFSVNDASTPGAGVKTSINSIALNSIGSRYGLGFNTTSGVNNVERMRIDDDGNVGIGTTSPGTILHASDVNGAVLRLERKATNVLDGDLLGGIETYRDDDDGAYIQTYIKSYATEQYGRHGYMTFGTNDNNNGNATERMRITSNGNVGIGTTSPISLLEISKQLSAASTIDYPYTISSRDDGNSINQAGGEGVGIKFRIAGNASTTPGDSLVGASIAAIREIASDSDSSTGLGFFVTQNDETLDEALRIDHDRNIQFNAYGAGTLVSDASGNITATTTPPGTGVFVPLAGGSLTGQAMTGTLYGPGATFYVSGDNSSNLKVGDGSFRMEMGRSSIQARVVGASGAASSLNLNPSGGDVLFTGSGNVGIGTTSPDTKLEVAGITTIKSPKAYGSEEAVLRIGVTSSGTNYSDGTFHNIVFGNESVANSHLGEIQVVQGDASVSTASDMRFFTNSGGGNTATNEAMRITSAGNVGIGTTSPNTLLDVSSGNFGATAPTVRITNTINVGDWSPVTSDLGRFEFFTDDTSGNAPYTLGYIGIKNDYTTGAPTLPSGAMVFATTTYNALGGAVERMRIDSSGNVGIGTDSPSANLEIESASNPEISIASTGGATSNYLNFKATSHTQPIQSQIKTVDNNDFTSDLVFSFKGTGTSGALTERMRIEAGGNVGIGTDDPSAKLDVNGIADINSIIIGTNGDNIYHNDSDFYIKTETAHSLIFRTSNVNRLKISEVGNVGIGVTSLAAKLNVVAGAGSPTVLLGRATGQASIKADTDSSGHLIIDSSTGHVYINNYVNKNIYLANGGGNVGIGTTSPSAKLQVNNQGEGEFAGGNASAAGSSHIMLRDEGGTTRTLMSGPSIVFQTPASADGTNIWATSRLLGSPAAAGSARGTFSIQVRDLYDPLSDGTSWNWRTALTAINTGNVGIGTTSPSEKLEVVGNVILDVADARLKIKGGVAGTNSGIDWTFNSNSTVYAKMELDYDTRASTGFLIDSGYPMTLDYSSGSFSVKKNGSSELTITNGNVGIGTTNPQAKLHVSGGSSIETTLIVGAEGTGNDKSARVFLNEGEAGVSNSKDYGFSLAYDGQGAQYAGLSANQFGILRHNNSAGGAAVMVMNRTNNNTTFTGTVTGTNFILSSDERLKKNIEEVDNKSIKADWKTFELKTEKGQKRYGVIAQELEKTNPEFVREDTQGFKSVAYIDLLIAKIAELEARLEKLEK